MITGGLPMNEIMKRLCHPAFFMDCIIVGVITSTFLITYAEVTGLSLRAEHVSKNYHTQVLTPAEGYEFLILTHKEDQSNKVVLKIKEPEQTCSNCQEKN